jgi:chromate transporter
MKPASQNASSLGELLRLFLRLGLTAFGGPAAHLALMQREAVDRRQWLSRSQFLDLTGACNLLPGPGSTQVAMALGFRRAGWPGLLVAGACFILPASLSTLGLAWIYVRFGSLPLLQGLLYGAKPVMLAILLQAVWNLGKSAYRTLPLALLGVASLAGALAGVPPLAVLLLAGGLVLLVQARRAGLGAVSGFFAQPSTSASRIGLATGAGLAGSAVGAAGLLSLALVFLKLGVAVFGSGYVLLAFLKADLVDRLHWITPAQLLDAVTAGQLTPGPVFATATFLGFLLHGFSGAAVATLAIFLPSFGMAAAAATLAGRIRNSKRAGAFLDGVNAAAVALMASVALPLGRAALLDGITWGIALVSAFLLLRYRLNATWLILAAGILGGVLYGAHWTQGIFSLTTP